MTAPRAGAEREEVGLTEGKPELPELGAVGFEEPHKFAPDATGPADGDWCACGKRKDDPRHQT